MQKLIVLGSLVVIMMISGCIFDSDTDKKTDVKKGSVSGTVKLTVTQNPVSGIKVYLIKANSAVDSTSIESIRSSSAFVDSAVTDSNGKYSITNIAPGSYVVAPVNEDTTAVYTFAQSAASDSCQFSINGNSLSVNFIAEKKDFPGADYSVQIREEVLFKNCTPVGGVVYRRYWAVWVPFVLAEPGFFIDDWNPPEKYMYHQNMPGYSIGLYTVDNCYFYEVTLQNGPPIKFTISHPLVEYKLTYYYIYDYNTNTLTECAKDFK